MSVYVALELGMLALPVLFLWIAFKYNEGSYMRVIFLVAGLIMLLPTYYLNIAFIHVAPDFQNMSGTQLEYKNSIESIYSNTYFGYIGFITVLLTYILITIVIMPLINAIRDIEK